MRSVLVMGAGPAGAVAALCLARRGHQITVLDKDGMPPLALDEWQRRSVTHIAQGHTFLALGTAALERELPDVLERMIAGGAHRVALTHDPARWNLFIRRKRFDAFLRDALSREPGVRLLPDLAASELLMAPAGPRSPPHVFGVGTSKGDLTADIVVDASGRRSGVPTWLSRRGIHLAISNDPTNFFYLTRHYRLQAGRSFPSTKVPIVVALPYATVLAFPEDRDYFQLTIQVDSNDPTKRRLRDGATFDRFLSQVPLISPWIERGTPLDEPEPLGSVGNCRKQLWHETARVTGLLLLGDAAAHTNPTAGRGVALAIEHARALACLIADPRLESCSPDALAARWEDTTSSLMDPWFKSQVEIDHDRRQQIRASLQGKPMDVVADARSRLAAGLAEMHECEIVGSAAERLFNLLATPNEITADRSVMRRLLKAGRRAPAPYLGPTRQHYEQLVGTDDHFGY